MLPERFAGAWVHEIEAFRDLFFALSAATSTGIAAGLRARSHCKVVEEGAIRGQPVCEWSKKGRQTADEAEVYRNRINFVMLAKSKPDVCD